MFVSVLTQVQRTMVGCSNAAATLEYLRDVPGSRHIAILLAIVFGDRQLSVTKHLLGQWAFRQW